MATTSQVGEILARRLNLPDARPGWVASRLRPAGLLPAAQGSPVQLTATQVATFLIAMIVGSRADDAPHSVSAYADLRADGWGPTLADTIAAGIEGRARILELRLDLAGPGAVVTVADGHHAIIQRFTDDSPRPNFRREAIISGDVLAHVFDDIRAAPEVRAGRRKRMDTFKI